MLSQGTDTVMKEFESRSLKHLLDLSRRRCPFTSGTSFPSEVVFKAYLVNFQGFNFFYTVLPPLLPFLHLLFSFLLLPPPLLESGNIMVAVSFPGVLVKSHECFRSGRTGSLWVTRFAPHYSIIPWPCINVILYRIIMRSFSLSSSFWQAGL